LQLFCNGAISFHQYFGRYFKIKYVKFSLGEGCELGENTWTLLSKSQYDFHSTYESYMESMSKDGVFSSNHAHVMISFMLGVNVISFTNSSKSIEEFNSSSFLSSHTCFHLPSDSPAVYVYHHRFGFPMSPIPSSQPHLANHFCYLMPTTGILLKGQSGVYQHSITANHDSILSQQITNVEGMNNILESKTPSGQKIQNNHHYSIGLPSLFHNLQKGREFQIRYKLSKQIYLQSQSRNFPSHYLQ